MEFEPTYVAWSYERQLAYLEHMDRTFLIEKPVYRGAFPGKNVDLRTSERILQACRLRESGWSTWGLAHLYRVRRAPIQRWLLTYPEQSLCFRRAGRVPLVHRMVEVIALVQLGCWDPDYRWNGNKQRPIWRPKPNSTMIRPDRKRKAELVAEGLA